MIGIVIVAWTSVLSFVAGMLVGILSFLWLIFFKLRDSIRKFMEKTEIVRNEGEKDGNIHKNNRKQAV